MSWQPEDWELRSETSEAGPAPLHRAERTLLELLLRIPDVGQKSVVQLGRVGTSNLDLPSARFGRLIRLEDPTDLARFRRAVDIVIVPQAIFGIALRRDPQTLLAMRDCLVEGGLVLGTCPAVLKSAGVFELPLGPAQRSGRAIALHEVEVHFRLTRVGFPAVRVQRVREDGREEAILVAAVRRALN